MDEPISMELIFHAGNSKSLSMKAIYASREGNFTEAEELLKEAQKEMVAAHEIQTSLLCADDEDENSPKFQLDMLMVHAQDHLTMATLMLDIADEFIRLRKETAKK